MSSAGYVAAIVAGLLLGLGLAAIAARTRRHRMARELGQAEAELERLGYIEAALAGYPFGDGIPTVTTARVCARLMRDNARARAAAIRQELADKAPPR